MRNNTTNDIYALGLRGMSAHTTNDEDIFAFSCDVRGLFLPIEQGLCVCMEKFHGKMDALEVASFDR